MQEYKCKSARSLGRWLLTCLLAISAKVSSNKQSSEGSWIHRALELMKKLDGSMATSSITSTGYSRFSLEIMTSVDAIVSMNCCIHSLQTRDNHILTLSQRHPLCEKFHSSVFSPHEKLPLSPHPRESLARPSHSYTQAHAHAIVLVRNSTTLH